MNRKLIFLDIDGTLIHPGAVEAPASAVEAIHAAQANGHKVFLCTGRNYNMTKGLLHYGFDGYVCSAGGYVVCDGNVLFDCPMEPQQRDTVRALLAEAGMALTLEARDVSFGDARMRAHFARHIEERAANAPQDSEEARWAKAFADGKLVRPIEEYADEPIYKICYRGTAQQLEMVQPELEKDFVVCRLNMPGDNAEAHGELINRKFNKGSGIARICEALGCTLADTIGFGDSMNDLEMTDVVGISVCMANGVEELKKRCDRVCPSVSEDGIAKEFAALGLIS
jgi:hypothetical protein